nr:hypothetical protein [Oceanococcus sp. HetDA_MAG_MS8]
MLMVDSLLRPCRIAVVLLGGIILSACGGLDTVAEPTARRFQFQTEPGDDIRFGFAEYPPGQEEDFNLEAGWERVPGAANTGTNGIFLNGNNRSDDLFMFFSTRITGLASNARYTVSFSVQLYTREGEGCVGIGGAPGESVFVKAGLTRFRPEVVNDGSGQVRVNVDKGNQAESGSEAIVIGDLAGSRQNCTRGSYEVKNLSSAPQTFNFTTDVDGDAWLIVGTDSGFEGETRVYYTEVLVDFQPR